MMELRTRKEHIANLERAIEIFKGNRGAAKGSTVTEILEQAAVSFALLNHQANREDAFLVAYQSGKKDAVDELTYLQFYRADENHL